MLLKLKGNSTTLKIQKFFLIIGFFTIFLEAAPCNCCPPNCCPLPKPPIVSSIPKKPKLPNDCEKWLPIEIEDNLFVTVQVYDKSITEHDHDCDGIVDSLDEDVDENGIVVVRDSAYIKQGKTIYIDVLANDLDVDVGGYIDKSTLKIVSKPLHGTVQIVKGKVYYVPDTKYIGTDKFTYVVKDNEGMLSKPTPVIIYIKERNRQPIAQNQSLKTQEDISVSIKLRGSDPDNDGLIYKIVNKPSYGKLKGKAPNLTYTPQKDFSGNDFFTFQVYDGALKSSLAKVKIQVLPVNDNPIAKDDNVTTGEGVPVSIKPLLNDTDTDGNTSKLHIIAISKPHNGIALLYEDSVYYTPKSASATSDSMTYTIEDEGGGKATARIKINILQKNNVPIAKNQTVETKEDQSVSFVLSGMDPDGKDLTYTLVYTQYVPEHGLITGNAPKLTYTPDANYTGEDYIVFKVDDGELESSLAVVNIVVHPLNDPPVADAGDDESVKRGDSVVLDGSDSYDLDGNITAYEWKEGNVTLSTQKEFSYIFYEEGVHTVTLIVKDDHNAMDTDTKIVTVNPCCEGCVYPDPTDTNPFN
jgi:hypothetical protein